MGKRGFDAAGSDEEDKVEEIYNRTGTRPEDWQPLREDIETWSNKHKHTDPDDAKTLEIEQNLIEHLGTKYVDYDPPLLRGLSKEGVCNAIRTMIRQVCSNESQQQHAKRSSEQRSSSLGEHSDRSIATGGMSVSSALKKQRTSNADLESINLTVIYHGQRVKFLLADLAQSAKPSLPLEYAVSRTTMETFVRCCGEDLGLTDLQVDVWFRFQGSEYATKLKSDRQLHGALRDIVDSGHPHQAFELVPINQTLGRQPAPQSAAALRSSSE
jgi:hypothetical protein